ncbi:hypothetical protein RSal33209_2585 [Renibacterium salmoninarum ATCC 33209]|uniref:Uncharacterized protein n=1 Tax=Renibacterium salmoninarum (strain ATCC 33209 / DSM 20767 / JCM 11484 / NBRC 15589 / NCIMB 2235) TaxID=288705 RepID=A9WRM8_RENSM|nr:hypothetical protein [Renibacterium salmoninarum]ABY24310.1 hypothetical protein RSal33209_2585 [Renibacterium salmoninarum ATCC 33209]
MEQNPVTPEESAPAVSKFAALPERTLPADYIKVVDVDQVNFQEVGMDDWLKNSAG